MPRKPYQAPPVYCLHKASGKAVVQINRQDLYLGPYGSPESHADCSLFLFLTSRRTNQ